MARRVASFVVLLLMAATVSGSARTVDDDSRGSRLDPALRGRAAQPRGLSRVIIETVDGGPATAAIKAAGGRAGRYLRTIGQVAVVSDKTLLQLGSHPGLRSVSLDRRVE